MTKSTRKKGRKEVFFQGTPHTTKYFHRKSIRLKWYQISILMARPMAWVDFPSEVTFPVMYTVTRQLKPTKHICWPGEKAQERDVTQAEELSLCTGATVNCPLPIRSPRVLSFSTAKRSLFGTFGVLDRATSKWKTCIENSRDQRKLLALGLCKTKKGWAGTEVSSNGCRGSEVLYFVLGMTKCNRSYFKYHRLTRDLEGGLNCSQYWVSSGLSCLSDRTHSASVRLRGVCVCSRSTSAELRNCCSGKVKTNVSMNKASWEKCNRRQKMWWKASFPFDQWGTPTLESHPSRLWVSSKLNNKQRVQCTKETLKYPCERQ